MGMRVMGTVVGAGAAIAVSALIFVNTLHIGGVFRNSGTTGSTAANHTPTASQAPGPLVVIDPGHGAEDPGARSIFGTPEKDITWQISARIAHDLAAKGVNVTLTRKENENPSLSQRLSYGLSGHAAFFLSVHANQFDGSSAIRGAEIHVFDPSKFSESRYPGTKLSAAAAKQSIDISESIVNQMKAHPVGIPVRSGDPTGIRYDVDFVCRLSDGPAALIELGYLSNPDDAKLLTDPHAQEIYAEDIANGIAAKVLLSHTDLSSKNGTTKP